MSAAGQALAPVRSHGTIRVAFAHRHGRTGVRRTFQQGCLRIRLPRARPLPEAVLMNTAGGLACGDTLDQSFRWDADARIVVTTPAAERVYRAIGTGAVVATRIVVAAGAAAEWLPQETILFDGARLTRRLDVEMAAGASFLGLEAVVLGRKAMGEAMRRGALVDRWRVRRGGTLVYADAFRVEGDAAAAMARRALGGGAAAFATMLDVSPDATARRDAVRDALPAGRGGASAWNGMLAVRLVAPDGGTLRADLARVLAAIRAAPLPRCWGA